MSDQEHRRLRTPAAADYVGYSKSTLEKKRLSGDGPTFIRLGRAVVYDTRDLDTYLDARRATSTSDRLSNVPTRIASDAAPRRRHRSVRAECPDPLGDLGKR
jgi:predicted DNA-binding transcriptional regulator AlpA